MIGGELFNQVNNHQNYNRRCVTLYIAAGSATIDFFDSFD